MRLKFPRPGGEQAFTLIELIIAIAITGVIVSAIAGALIVSLETTNVTQQRLAESHDVQITSAYLANDVQSAATVTPSSGGTCSGATTKLITFAYASGKAVYSCGTASNGETQVTRTFGTDSVVLAHFAGAARPTVICSPNAACNGTVDAVTMAFTEASGLNYTLLGSRRGYSSGGGGGGTSPGDVTVLSTGTSSPLWVQGSCPDPGTSAACAIDPSLTALPISDVSNNGWTPIPATPTTLWDKLSDQSDTTGATISTKNQEARVELSPVNPPDVGVTPTVEVRALSVANGAVKLTASIYNGGTLLVSNQINSINSFGNYDWLLTTAEANRIPSSAYAHLTIGFSFTGGNSGSGITVAGMALDTATPAGLLTVKGSLYVNSTSSSAVKLSGSKTATKMTIDPGDFRILQPGACTGCNHSTVSCPNCAWSGNQPWTSYPTPLVDPLRSLAAPDPAALGAGGCGGSVCQPGVYSGTLSRTANTTLNPGIYYLKQGISVTGSASLSCASPCAGGVMLYIAGGSATLAGGSTIDLPAPSSGTYKDIVVFQARTDSNPVKIAGNAGSSTPISFGGIIYVPNSTQVTLATGTATLTAKAIVAQNIKVSSPVTIG
jgi:prepilin-type N-terminal cleavage/methylation domain-containing protein